MSSSPLSSSALYARRCGSMRTWQRSAIAWMTSAVASVMRSRAVSCGAAAYSSTKTSTMAKSSSLIAAPRR